MSEFKKEQATDKTELKKIAAQIADFRTILLKSKLQPAPIKIKTPIFPVAFPIFAFTFTTERKKYSRSYLHTIKSRGNFNYGTS